MNNFINYNNGVISLSSDQVSGTRLTEMEELIEDVTAGHREPLSVSLNEFIAKEIKKIDLSAYDFKDINEVKDFIFGEADFLELTLNELNVDVSDYPDLRDPQNDLCQEWEESVDK